MPAVLEQHVPQGQERLPLPPHQREDHHQHLHPASDRREGLGDLILVGRHATAVCALMSAQLPRQKSWRPTSSSSSSYSSSSSSASSSCTFTNGFAALAQQHVIDLDARGCTGTSCLQQGPKLQYSSSSGNGSSHQRQEARHIPQEVPLGFLHHPGKFTHSA